MTAKLKYLAVILSVILKLRKLQFIQVYIRSNFQVEFSKDSLLQKIGNNAFHCSNNKTIKILKKVTRIGKNTFSKCSNLTKAKIPLDSELLFVGEGAFTITKIKSLNIPSHLRDIPDLCAK